MSFFDNLEHLEREREDSVNGTRAIIAANTRVAKTASYVKKATDTQEFEARLSFVAGDIRRLVEGACEEYGTDNPDKVYRTVVTNLRGKTACKACGCDMEDCKDGNCKCGNCSTCDKSKESNFGVSKCPGCGKEQSGDGLSCTSCGYDADKNEDKDKKKEEVKTASVRRTAAPDLGDSYWHDVIDMPSAGESGLSDVGSPKIDKGNAGDEAGSSQSAPDVPSNRNQLDHQHPDDRAEYDNSDFDPSNPVRERVNPDTAIQPELHAAPHTKTFPNTNQADPVTNKASKWRVVQ